MEQEQQQRSGFSESSHSPQSSAVETDSGNGRRQESVDNGANSNTTTTSSASTTSTSSIDRDKLKSREAQRALRERKLKYVQDLEAEVKELETVNAALRARVREQQSPTAASAQHNVHSLLYNHSYHNLTAGPVLPAAPVVPSSPAVPYRTTNNSHIHSLRPNDSNSITNTCSVCIAARERASITATRIPVLKSLIATSRSSQANNQNQSDNQTNFFHHASIMVNNTNNNIQSNNPLYKSAHDLYGPIEVESCRICCKNIPSLRDHTVHIDTIFDILQVGKRRT
ncbi:hypothetical protein HK100_005071 [Physocladia obscura]|uniref:BZIP domain-containing protein n=1 Tax=Physocladia obscura TaxID=109957 RepID=A0AAD5SXS6_9FUNG|nr:hypothetical protein HK100_005071 [Physocladia obscura]